MMDEVTKALQTARQRAVVGCDEELLALIDAALAAQSAAPVGGGTGCICQEQHRRGYCTEPGCCFAISAPIAPQVREETITELANRRDAIAMAIYISWLNASPEDAPEHFDWYHKGKSNPKSCVHYSNVAKALKAADAVLVTFDAALSVKPGEEVETGPVTVNEYEDAKKLEKQP